MWGHPGHPNIPFRFCKAVLYHFGRCHVFSLLLDLLFKLPFGEPRSEQHSGCCLCPPHSCAQGWMWQQAISRHAARGPHSTCLLLSSAFSAEQHSPFATSYVCISYLTSADSCTLLLCCWLSPCTHNVTQSWGSTAGPFVPTPVPGHLLQHQAGLWGQGCCRAVATEATRPLGLGRVGWQQWAVCVPTHCWLALQSSRSGSNSSCPSQLNCFLFPSIRGCLF